jgi:hypothetical protein
MGSFCIHLLHKAPNLPNTLRWLLHAQGSASELCWLLHAQGSVSDALSASQSLAARVPGDIRTTRLEDGSFWTMISAHLSALLQVL